MADITIVNGVYKPIYNWGVPSCKHFWSILCNVPGVWFSSWHGLPSTYLCARPSIKNQGTISVTGGDPLQNLRLSNCTHRLSPRKLIKLTWEFHARNTWCLKIYMRISLELCILMLDIMAKFWSLNWRFGLCFQPWKICATWSSVNMSVIINTYTWKYLKPPTS